MRAGVDGEKAMGITSTAYKIVLLLHILCAIVGFGAVFLNGLYGREAKRRPGPGGLAISEANLFVSGIAEYFIYAVFILGLGLVGLSDKTWKFDQTWIWLAVVLYIVGIGVSHGIVFPNARRLKDLAAEMVGRGRRRPTHLPVHRRRLRRWSDTGRRSARRRPSCTCSWSPFSS